MKYSMLTSKTAAQCAAKTKLSAPVISQQTQEFVDIMVDFAETYESSGVLMKYNGLTLVEMIEKDHSEKIGDVANFLCRIMHGHTTFNFQLDNPKDFLRIDFQ